MLSPMFAVKTRRTALVSPLLAGIILILAAGSAEGDGNEANCKARSNTDPGRLNIAAEPEGYGAIPPCKPYMDFYIARNTPLRSLEGVLRISTSDDDILSMKPVNIDLERTDYGMFAARAEITVEANETCPGLSVSLEVENCRGDGDRLIECPEIRVKTPRMFAGLSISGKDLSICYDN
ncbi:MAG: hypothetical protein WD750_00280 [Gammaproteobacteria bacterium]